MKKSAKQIENICLLHDLVDIWRVRNLETKRFTWRQKTPIIQRRLDFWLVDNALQEEIDQADIVPSIKSDHSAIGLPINGIVEQIHGPSFWKFNARLLDDKDYVTLINSKYEVWVEEFKDIDDPRLFWDLIKYKIRQDTIVYSKCKVRERKAKMADLEKKLKNVQVQCDQDPSPENVNKLEILKTEYDLQYEYIYIYIYIYIFFFFSLLILIYLQDFHLQCLQHFSLHIKIYLHYTYVTYFLRDV